MSAWKCNDRGHAMIELCQCKLDLLKEKKPTISWTHEDYAIKYAKLESELSKLKATGKEVADEFWKARCKADKRIEELEGDLKRYGYHKGQCLVSQHDCTCGLTEALKVLGKWK